MVSSSILLASEFNMSQSSEYYKMFLADNGAPNEKEMGYKMTPKSLTFWGHLILFNCTLPIKRYSQPVVKLLIYDHYFSLTYVNGFKIVYFYVFTDLIVGQLYGCFVFLLVIPVFLHGHSKA